MFHKLQKKQNYGHYVILTSALSQPHIHTLYTGIIRMHSISAEADQWWKEVGLLSLAPPEYFTALFKQGHFLRMQFKFHCDWSASNSFSPKNITILCFCVFLPQRDQPPSSAPRTSYCGWHLAFPVDKPTHAKVILASWWLIACKYNRHYVISHFQCFLRTMCTLFTLIVFSIIDTIIDTGQDQFSWSYDSDRFKIYSP